MIKDYDYIITGMGAAGLILAYNMSKDRFFDTKAILLMDKSIKNVNDRTWCFWNNDHNEVEDLVSKSWGTIGFKGEDFDKDFSIYPSNYKCINSIDLYNKLIEVISGKDNFYMITSSVSSINEQGSHVIVQAGRETYTATKVFNSIIFDFNFRNDNTYPLLHQHFVGWFIETDTDQFNDKVADFMDFSVPQKGNTRFMYVLPFTKRKALVEYTLFSKDLLKKEEYDRAIEDYLLRKGITNYKVVDTESGCIPMTCFPFWKKNSKNIIHIGTAGGWTKASTGFTFSSILRKTDRLILHIKSDKSLNSFNRTTKYWFYDLLFLDFLSQNNERGKEIFTRMFKSNDPERILRFLDEETTFWEEVRIMSSMPRMKFTMLFFKRFLKHLF